jgi:hypothetical protein
MWISAPTRARARPQTKSDSDLSLNALSHDQHLSFAFSSRIATRPALHNRYAAMLCHRGGAETRGRYLAAAVLSSADAQASATPRWGSA